MNEELVSKIREIRDRVVRHSNPTRYVSAWTEKEYYKNKAIDSFVIILRTGGCFWFKHSGCSMCGYYNDTNLQKVSDADLRKQLESAVNKYNGQKIVKIYNSGSFFDDQEISESMQFEVLDFFKDAERIVVESRPEYIRSYKLEKFKRYKDRLMVAIGLESATDEILENSINKGFKRSEFKRAAELLNVYNIPLKTYILIKPIHLTEKDAIEDAVKSAEFAADYSELISFNPVNVQSYTLTEALWKKGAYRPPWLWSVVEVLRRTRHLGTVISAPTGTGARSTHNCGKCDDAVLKNIEDFSMTQDPEILEKVTNCKCKEFWHKVLEIEQFTLTTIGQNIADYQIR